MWSASTWELIVGIMRSLSPFATSVGWVIPASRLSWLASGIPHSTIASYCLSATSGAVRLVLIFGAAECALDVGAAESAACLGDVEENVEEVVDAVVRRVRCLLDVEDPPVHLVAATARPSTGEHDAPDEAWT